MKFLLAILAFCLIGQSFSRILKVTHKFNVKKYVKNLKRALKARSLFMPAMLKASLNPPESFTVLSPMVKNPNLEITTYGELENVDLTREPVVSEYAAKAMG